ncbi:MAG: hypothetical protein IKJ01_01475 [Lachnospiraceae bacterium]|nr:hypothetical protein [Lachnospiraceae bacterium]
MNNIVNGFRMNQEMINFIKDCEICGCIALGIYAVHDLCVRAIEKGYAFNIKFDTKGMIDFSVTPSTVTVE